MDFSELQKRFRTQELKGRQALRYRQASDVVLDLAQVINNLCNDSRAKSMALTQLEVVLHWVLVCAAEGESEK